MKKIISVFCIMAILFSMIVPVRATMGVDEYNGRVITLSMSFSSDKLGNSPINSVDKGETFYIVVRYSGNPTNLTDSLCCYELGLSYGDKISIDTVYSPSNREKGGVEFFDEYAAGHTCIVDISLSGFGDEDGIKRSGILFAVKVTANRNLSASDLSEIYLLSEDPLGKREFMLLDWDVYLFYVRGTTNTVPVTNVSLNTTDMDMKVGDRKQLYATCYPINATDKRITWSSDNPSVAAVDSNGVVYANNNLGYATITARSINGKTAECCIEVKSKKDISFYNYQYSFLNGQGWFGYPDHYRIPFERYMQAGFSVPVAGILYIGEWGGNCFGMSVSSILFYEDVLKEYKYDINAVVPQNFGEYNSANGAKTVASPKYKKLREMIELFQVSQKLTSYDKFRDFKTLNEGLEEGHPVLFILADKWGFDAHAVVIYNYYYDNTNGYTYQIYDCSSAVSALKLDNNGYRLIKAGTSDTESDKYFASYFISSDSVKNVFNKIRNNNSWNSASLFSVDNTRNIYVKRVAENMIITNSRGEKAIIKNGKLISAFEGAEIATNSYLDYSEECFVILPSDTYTIVGESDEAVTTSVADDYLSAEVTVKSSTPVTISADLRNIDVGTENGDEYRVQYTTFDNIFDEMTLTGSASGTISTRLLDTEVEIDGAETLSAEASVSDSTVSANSENLEGCGTVTINCEDAENGATLQILSENAELTEKAPLPERLQVEAPEYDLESGEYDEGKVLTFTKDNETVVYYTTDGSIPSADNGIIYSMPIEVNKTMTINAISTKYGYEDSEIVELNYVLPEVDMPLASLESGEYDNVVSVSLTTDDYSDEIYYTLDGSDPFENGILYTVPLNISEDTLLQAYTLRNGCVSEVCEYEYTITPVYPFYFSNALTNQNGEVITADNTGDLTQINATLTKLTDGEHSGCFVAAIYDEDDRLIYLKSAESKVVEDVTTVEFDVEKNVSKAKTIKVFALKDLTGFVPLCAEYVEQIASE